MKRLLLLLTVFLSVNSYCQKDSIVNYLNKQFIVTSNKNDVKYIESKVKEGSLWKVNFYYRDGKVFRKAYSKHKKKNVYVGKYLSFHRNGKLSEKSTYNNKGELNGKIITFFDNGNRNYSGLYENGIRKGLWKYYRYDGGLASKFYYDDKGGLEKFLLFDENGLEVKEKNYKESIDPFFSKGNKDFYSKLHYMMDNLSYAINTKIDIDFIIDVDGSIRDVWVVNNVPKKLKEEISDFFESIKGWEPAEEMSRKVPYNYNVALGIKTRVVYGD